MGSAEEAVWLHPRIPDLDACLQEVAEIAELEPGMHHTHSVRFASCWPGPLTGRSFVLRKSHGVCCPNRRVRARGLQFPKTLLIGVP